MYRLSEAAKEDLIRIHQYGLYRYGEVRADRYYFAFFDQFERIAEQPFLYQSVDHIRPGYRRCVCGVDSIFYRIEKGVVEIMSIIGRKDIDSVLDSRSFIL